MISVLLQTIMLASGGIISVGSITIVLLLLISENGKLNGLGYAGGYTIAYSLIGVSAVLIGYRVSEAGRGGPGLFLPLLFMCLGVLLLYFGARNWRKGPQETDKPLRFFKYIDAITPLKAFGFGIMVGFINFKNLVFFLSGISVVMMSALLLSQKIIVALLTVLVFCSAVLIPVVVVFAIPERAEESLGWMKSTIDRYRYQISICLPLVFGVLFVVRGVRSFM